MTNSGENSRQTIGLVTVLYNSERHLPLFFECLAQQSDHDFRVIVVDNASTDRSLALTQQLAAQYKVDCDFIANDSNVGVAEGNNQGIQYAHSQGIDHILLINNDIACDAQLIEAIRRRAITGGHRAWTCFAFLHDSANPWYGGGRLSYWRARAMHYSPNRAQRITAPTRVTYAPTCLMYVHSSVFDAIGLMDQQYFVYYDDTDFCKRMQRAGIPLIYDPAVQIRHYVGGSTGGDHGEFFLRINTRNKFIYIGKHYAPPLRWVVAAVAIASKLIQLLNPRRRRGTWLGLMDALHRSA